MRDLDPSQYSEGDRREVNLPIEVEAAAWSPGGTLDWWVKERQQWLGRVRGPDGRQKWVKAADLRPAKRPHSRRAASSQPLLSDCWQLRDSTVVRAKRQLSDPVFRVGRRARTEPGV